MNHPNDKKRPNTNGGSLGQFKRGRERMIHVSAQAHMIASPLGVNHPAVPWTQKPGITFRKRAAA